MSVHISERVALYPLLSDFFLSQFPLRVPKYRYRNKRSFLVAHEQK